MGCPKAPYPLLCTKSGCSRLSGATGWGRGILCLAGDARAGHPRLTNLVGKLRQHDGCITVQAGEEAALSTQDRAPTPVAAHGHRGLNAGTGDNLGTLTGAFGKGSMS